MKTNNNPTYPTEHVNIERVVFETLKRITKSSPFPQLIVNENAGVSSILKELGVDYVGTN